MANAQDKLAPYEIKMREGIKELTYGQYIFDSFQRGLREVSHAMHTKNYGYLNKAEAAFEMTINEIRDMKNLDPHQKSLYLFSLQNYIFSLQDLKIEGAGKNDFVPSTIKKMYKLTQKAEEKGMDETSINTLYNQCFSTQYQSRKNNDPLLGNFQFLDERIIEQRMNELTAGRKIDLQPKEELYGGYVIRQVDAITLDKMILSIENNFKEELSNDNMVHYFTDNLETVQKYVGSMTRQEDEKTINNVIDKIVRRLASRSKIQENKQGQSSNVNMNNDMELGR